MYSPYAHPVGVYAVVWGDVLHLQTLTMVEFPLALQNIIPKGQDKAHIFLHSLTMDFAKKPPSTGTAAALAQHGPGFPKPGLATISSSGSASARKCVH